MTLSTVRILGLTYTVKWDSRILDNGNDGECVHHRL